MKFYKFVIYKTSNDYVFYVICDFIFYHCHVYYNVVATRGGRFHFIPNGMQKNNL